MKMKAKSTTEFVISTPARIGLVACLAAIAMTSLPSLADDHGNRAERYVQVNLVSDQAGAAQIQDTNLVNAWGVSFGKNTPFWISDNGTGKATLYSVTNDSSGMEIVTRLGLVVTIPGDGTPTGQFFNTTSGFHTNLFIFVSEDGTISGWRPALGTTAEVLAAPSNTVYKGVTLATNSSGPVLLAANFAQATIDAYDPNMTLIAQFSDPHAPMGYAPFNVQNIEGLIFVTYAKQDADKHDDVAGRGHGLIDVLNPQTGNFHRFATGSDAGGKLKEIDSPWGVVLAPDSFGRNGGELLVGNFGSGTIMTFNAEGEFQGLLKGERGGRLVIDGLWALTFGNGTSAGSSDTLFFTAGPDGESHGLFGSLQPSANHERDGDNNDQGDNDDQN
jgi:uncharacterized protein (TIGR03118 family)